MLKSADVAVAVLHELAPLIDQALDTFGFGADGSVSKRNLLPPPDMPVRRHNNVLVIVHPVCIAKHPKEGWHQCALTNGKAHVPVYTSLHQDQYTCIGMQVVTNNDVPNRRIVVIVLETFAR